MEKKKNTKKVLILDYDGTLYKGSIWQDWGKYAHNFLILQFGVEGAEIFRKRHGFKNFIIVGQEMASAFIKDFGSAKVFYDYQDKNNFVLDQPDIKFADVDKIKELKKYAKLYLVSNSPVSYIESNSKSHGFDTSIFDGIYSNQFNAEDVTKFDVYKTIQEKENAMPENVFVVGDSEENDMKPAKRLGFNTLLVKELKDLDNVKLFVQKPIVKICANRNVGDAKMCLDASADLLGLLVGQAHSSTDFISKETAKEIVDFVNGRAGCVLVTHLMKADEIISLTKFIGNDYIQLHSNISESEVEKIVKNLPNVKLIRLVHVGQDGKIATDIDKFKFADFYLLDSFNKQTDQVGGTGLVHDWDVDKILVKELYKPVFIAGGLNPDNVASVIKIANPAGVDVNSGCKLNGIKNANLVKKFVKNAKNC